MPNTTKEKEQTPIFGDALTNLSKQDFTKKPAKLKAMVTDETIEKTAKNAGFQSREISTANQDTSRPVEQRRHRTGRNKQLSLKVRQEAATSFTDLCDDEKWVQGYAFERMLEALQRELASENTKAATPVTKG